MTTGVHPRYATQPSRPTHPWLLVLLVLLATCAAPAGSDEASRPSPHPGDDAVGDEPLPGVVRISNIDLSATRTSGVVRYHVDNVSGESQKLAWSVLFVYPPQDRGGDLSLPYDSVVPAAKELTLRATERDHELVARSPEFAERTARGEHLLAARLLAWKPGPGRLRARSDSRAGTKILDGRLECVGMPPVAFPRSLDVSLWLELENISERAVEPHELSVVFLGPENEPAGATPWERVSELAPGAIARVTLDTSRIPADVVRWGQLALHARIVD